MLDIVYSKNFKKEFNKQKLKLSFIEIFELCNILRSLQNKIKLDEKYCDHALSGKYKGFRDCHVKPDLILIYSVKDNDLILERLNSHSELF